MFKYVSDGSCSCCGLSLQGINKMIEACSDIETDDRSKDNQSPWPDFIREAVWKDRVVLRQLLKRQSRAYLEFWENSKESFVAFWRDLPVKQKIRCFQVPISELHQAFVHSCSESSDERFDQAFQVLVVTVLEQVAKFERTGYPDDAVIPNSTEHVFEVSLRAKKTSFYVTPEYFELDEYDDPEMEDFGFGFLARFVEMTQQTLLQRRPKREKNERKERDTSDSEGSNAENDENSEAQEHSEVSVELAETEKKEEKEEQEGQKGQSFKADRRILRVWIFRSFVNNVMHAYHRQEKIDNRLDNSVGFAAPSPSDIAPATTTHCTSTTTTGTAPVTPSTSTAKKGTEVKNVSLFFFFFFSKCLQL